MASSKPEKISINFKKPPADKQPEVETPAIDSAQSETEKNASQETTTDIDGGFEKAMHQPGETVVPRQASNVSDEKIVSKETKESEETTAQADDSADTQTLANEQPVDATDMSVAEEDEASYDDFYSSKLDLNKSAPKHADRPSSRDGKVTTVHSPRFWFILLIFLMTLSAGLVMLYQLEQAQPGAGLIFDWF